ncbi:MAG: helix-turn-helix domain-containing protein [Bacteroidetes bacterium]|nr:helix-turn-helix domain-containing protein [Bacteroidota bacterium]
MIPVHTNPEIEKKEIKVVELKSAAKEINEIHRHQFFECFVFLKGGGVHTIDFIDFPIQDNSIHIITPGQVHQVVRDANCHGFVFMFDLIHAGSNKIIEDFLIDHNCFAVTEIPPVYLFEDSFNEVMAHITKQCLEEFNSTNPLKNYLVTNQLCLLLLHCMQLSRKENLVQENKQLSTYTAFRRLLLSDFKQLKKVKDYAQKLTISEKQLNEISLQRSGETASGLIYKQTILEAKRLLNTGISAKEVAYELNFLDPAHFSKFFKSQTGMSPSEFKNIHD